VVSLDSPISSTNKADSHQLPYDHVHNGSSFLSDIVMIFFFFPAKQSDKLKKIYLSVVENGSLSCGFESGFEKTNLVQRVFILDRVCWNIELQ
jgi:hypothetical protein